MTSTRLNLFTFPHKGLRNAIAQLSRLTGQVECTDTQQLEALNSLADEVFLLLDLHANSEESVVLRALENKQPGSTTHNLSEHRDVEQQLGNLKKQLHILNQQPVLSHSQMFYSMINNFHSAYLAHMEMEESDINELLWKNFTDKELMQLHHDVMSSLTPEQVSVWFKYIVPALNQSERLAIMNGLKEAAPEPFFHSVLMMLKHDIAQGDFNFLRHQLGCA